MQTVKTQVAQPNCKNSPRPKTKPQIQASATPVRRAMEYAGPSFNHSPAPSTLPPPPFLSKSAPRRETLVQFNQDTPEVDSSPLGFLFSAKAKEDALKKMQTERPPALNYASTSQPQGPSPEPDHLHNNVKASIDSSKALPKKSAWAPLEKPRKFDISANVDSALSIAQTQGDRTIASKRFSPRNTADPNFADKQTIKAKKSNNDLTRKKRHSKDSPVKTTTPKTILKREQNQELPTTADEAIQPKSQSSKTTPANTFKPLRRKSPSDGKAVHIANAKRESEEELRSQAANLMAILRLQPPASPTSTRKSSPALGHYGNDQGSAFIEADLRRMLHMNA